MVLFVVEIVGQFAFIPVLESHGMVAICSLILSITTITMHLNALQLAEEMLLTVWLLAPFLDADSSGVDVRISHFQPAHKIIASKLIEGLVSPQGLIMRATRIVIVSPVVIVEPEVEECAVVHISVVICNGKMPPQIRSHLSKRELFVHRTVPHLTLMHGHESIIVSPAGRASQPVRCAPHFVHPRFSHARGSIQNLLSSTEPFGQSCRHHGLAISLVMSHNWVAGP